MTAWTTISNALVAVGAKPFASTMQALRDNVVAAFEGDPTATAAGITLRDAALDTGAATAAGTTWVGLRTASLAVGAVGSYGLFRRTSPLATAEPGTTVAGSNLIYTNAAAESSAPAVNPSGTWRLMGNSRNTNNETTTSLYLRIA